MRILRQEKGFEWPVFEELSDEFRHKYGGNGDEDGDMLNERDNNAMREI